MRVVFITPVTPHKENRGGPSGHPYHLMIERPEGIDITIYSFNKNHLSKEVIHQIEQNLNVTIKLVDTPRWINWILKHHLSFVRLLLKYPLNYYYRLEQEVVDEIKSISPDLIWCYSQEFSGIIKQFEGFKRLHTLPDSYTLHFYRSLGKRYTMRRTMERLRIYTNYVKHYQMERDYSQDENITYHLVGEEDRHFLQEMNPTLRAFFIRHPHYEIGDTPKERHFHQSKIKLLVAGRYDLYSQQTSDEVLECVLQLPHEQSESLKKHYMLTFLGSGWENHVLLLREQGYDVSHIKFAPDYIEEITKHDIQINPLSIGTGTKGKVLDALANGLLVMGTPIALENIAVENGISCIEWKSPEELLEHLMEIPNNLPKYEQMAHEGYQAIVQHHSRSRVSRHLFSLTN